MTSSNEELKVLVTGGARGIGAAVCMAFAEQGARVAINDLPMPPEEVQAALGRSSAVGPEAVWIPGDLSSVDECRRVVADSADQLSGLDVLVNNAGGPFGHVPFEDTTEEHFQRVLDVNLKAAFFVSQAAVAHLGESGNGRIVNVGSELFFLGHPELAAYAAAKGAIVGLTRSLALALAPSIRVNAVAPGPTATERLTAERWFKETGHEQVGRIPLGRWGEPQDIARAVGFLAGPESNWITGQVLNVNGGIVMP